MLFNIAPSNAERVKKEFTATRPEHAHGYFKSVILTSENRFYTYRIDMICGYYILTVRTRDKEQLEIIATFEEYKPGSIAATKGELYKNGSGYPYRIEKSERYLKKYDQLACIVHGAIAAGLLFDMLEDEPTPAPLPEESMPESCQKSPQEENMRRFTIYTDSNMAGIDSRGAYTTLAEARMRLEKELDEDETSRGGYIFDELRQKVTAIYNGFNLEKIPEPYRGTPNEYTTRKEAEAIRAALEEIKRRYDAQEAHTRPGTVTAEETPADATKARQEASQDATPATAASTAESVPECPTTAGTIAADTRTAGGTKATPQGQERATAAGGIAAHMKNANKPGHACENAPGRTEGTTAEHVHTASGKSPPRAPQRATTHGRPRGHPEKTANFGRFYPLLDFSRTIFANFQGIPISVCILGPVFDPEFWSPKPDPPGE